MGDGGDCRRRLDLARDTHVFITGRGRSGSNLMLGILQCHTGVFSRNEPNELPGSVMAALPDGFYPDPLPEGFAVAWHDALERAAARKGLRDGKGPPERDWYRSPRHGWISERLGQSHRLRRMLGRLRPSAGGPEWCLSRRLVDPEALARSLPVYKILRQPRWLLETHDRDAGQRVILVVRPPMAFLQSWNGRYVNVVPQGPEGVFADNMATVEPILAYFGRSFISGRAFSTAALWESELWRWRYVNEVLHTGLQGSDRYQLVSYGEMTADRCGTARRIYDWLGLELDAACARRLERLGNIFSERRLDSFDSGLAQDLIDGVLEGSTLPPSVRG